MSREPRTICPQDWSILEESLEGSYKLRDELLERYRYNVYAAQEKLAQSLRDADVNIGDYNFCEKHGGRGLYDVL